MICPRPGRGDRSGYATVVVLILIVLMTALTALNIEVAVRLHRRVAALDQQQKDRWQQLTNRPVASDFIRP